MDASTFRFSSNYMESKFRKVLSPSARVTAMTKEKAIELLEVYLSDVYSREGLENRIEINRVREYIIANLQ